MYIRFILYTTQGVVSDVDRLKILLLLCYCTLLLSQVWRRGPEGLKSNAFQRRNLASNPGLTRKLIMVGDAVRAAAISSVH